MPGNSLFRRNANSVAAFSLLLWACLPWGGAQAADPVAPEVFFRPPALSGAVMSPSGRYIAAVTAGAADARMRLVMLNLRELSKSKVLAAYSDVDIKSVRWVNDDRVVFTVTDMQSPYGDQLGEGLVAVDREGAEGRHPERSLIKRAQYAITTGSRPGDRELSARHRLHSVLRDGSNDVVVAEDVVDGMNQLTGVTLWRLDTVSGRATMLAQGGPANVRHWALDLRGDPRVAVSVQGGKSGLHWKAAADAPWTSVGQYETFADLGAAPNPIVVGAGDVLYLVGRAEKSSDATSLMRLDLSRKGAQPQSLIAIEGYDFQGGLVFGTEGDLLGVHYLADARGTHWLNPQLKGIQASVDRLLPGTSNRLDCGDCRDPASVLVASSSDRQPTVFHLYDVKAGTISMLAQSRPWLNPKAMANRDLVRFAARDGRSIPVHVTRPVGQNRPAAAMVLIHGGPYVRGGEWAWYAESQFLASRGYVVIEPEFRGSTGFGYSHFRAGWKQWGLAMQDDIADATLWAVKQGYADAKRICIAGASYGGYAALMGLIRYPELYRCGVNWVGVTDIDLMYSINWSDMNDIWREYGMPRLIGDREKDAAQLAATSPLKLAGKLTQPLLMAYGGLDRRVPIEHGVQLRNALSAHNANVEWVVYSDEGHGWMLKANKIDFWSRVERFLARNLGAHDR